MPEDHRPLPPFIGAEPDMLRAWLDFHRETLAFKCTDVTDSHLRQRAVPPSMLSLLGLVRHMAEVERHWFQRIWSDPHTPPLYGTLQETRDDADMDFHGVDEADTAETFQTWREQCAVSRKVVSSAESLDNTVRFPESSPGWVAGQPVSLRWIVVHMIEEYARHNGHADLLRERVDGVTGS